ncbi:MAG: IS3 family transposase [Gammaproteobacteria bacterium]|nr:IS3 family transposase [Gammaproteobacteria bacterium]
MNNHKNEFSIEKMSKVFNISRSGYYQFIQAEPSKRSLEDERLLGKIRVIHKESRQTYGSPRIHAELRSQGETCSRKRVARLMKKSGIEAKMKKRFKVTTKANPKAKAAPNLLQQDFTADMPNQRWVADFTYVATGEGWLYVAIVLDLFSRKIVGLAMEERMTADLVLKALEQAILHRKPQAGLIHHSDKGSQYTSQDFQSLLALYGFIASMSGTGNCFDNATAESFFHTLKTEHVYFEHYETRDQARVSIFEYSMIFYNAKRRHSTLGYLSPEVFEKQWYQKQNFQLHTVH